MTKSFSAISMTDPVKNGGKSIRENVKNVIQKDNSIDIILPKEKLEFDEIIICAGAWSNSIAKMVGENFPLDTERGYHVHFKGYDHLLSRPVIFLNRGFGITPMEQGLRVVGTVEFGGLNNPLSKSIY